MGAGVGGRPVDHSLLIAERWLLGGCAGVHLDVYASTGNPILHHYPQTCALIFLSNSKYNFEKFSWPFH